MKIRKDFVPIHLACKVSEYIRDLLAVDKCEEINAASVLCAYASHENDKKNVILPGKEYPENIVWPGEEYLEFETHLSHCTIMRAKRVLFHSPCPVCSKVGKTKNKRTDIVKQNHGKKKLYFPVWVFQDGMFRWLGKKEQRALLKSWFLYGKVLKKDAKFINICPPAINEARFISYDDIKKYNRSMKENLRLLEEIGIAYNAGYFLSAEGYGEGMLLVLNPDYPPRGFDKWRRDVFPKEYERLQKKLEEKNKQRGANLMKRVLPMSSQLASLPAC